MDFCSLCYLLQKPILVSMGCDAVEANGWICGLTAVRVSVDVHGPCYHYRLWGCPWSVLPPEAMPLSMSCAATWGHVDVCSPSAVCAATRGYVGVHGSGCQCWCAMLVCVCGSHCPIEHVDALGLYCHQGL